MNMSAKNTQQEISRAYGTAKEPISDRFTTMVILDNCSHGWLETAWKTSRGYYLI